MGLAWGQRGRQAELSEALADCLARLERGASLASVLALHPQLVRELEPLLQTARVTRTRLAVPIREERRLDARSAFLQAAARQRSAATLEAARRADRAPRLPSVLTRPLWSTFAPAIVAAALFVVALVPIMSITSTSALPGDWNYGFKRSAEIVRLALTLNPADRLNLELAFHRRRLGELEQLAASGRLTNSTLVEQLTTESSALVQSVSNNPQLGPSEALKVAQQTQAQVQALSDKIAPLAPASVKPAIDNAVQQTQQVEAQANEVAQAKVDAQASGSPAKYPHGGANLKNALPNADSSTATATATATATETPAATATATPTASPTATPSATGTAVALVPPPQTAPEVRAPAPSSVPSAPAPVLRLPSSPQTVAGTAPQLQSPPPSVPAPAPPAPAPLVPPAQPPNGQQVVAKPLPAGQQTSFVYNGPEQPIPQALASIAGYYDAVFFTQPQNGSAVYPWYPGQSDPKVLLEPGSIVTIQMKPGAPATLIYAVPGSVVGH